MPILGGCLCFDLPTGSKIIGGIYLCTSLLAFLMFVPLTAVTWSSMMDEFLANVMEGVQQEQQNMGHVDDETQQTLDYVTWGVEAIQENLPAVRAVLLVMLCVIVIVIVVSSMLIHSVRKNVRSLLVPYLVFEAIRILAVPITIIVFFAIYGSTTFVWNYLLNSVIGFCIQVLFFLVVLSQYQSLGNVRIQEEYGMN